MTPAPDPVTDRLVASPSSPRDAREWTPGFSDGLGDRFLGFDPSSTTALERLRFKRELSDSATFETALRQRVEQLHHLHHPSIASVRSVERIKGEGLVLESKHTAGRRLSELFPQARGAVFALELIRHLTPMLALLQKSGDGVAHGALSAERIVATRDGRLVMVEHVLGSALTSLQFPASKFRSDYGLALPAGDVAVLDGRADLIQLGFLALSLLLGRRLSSAEYPANIEGLLDEFSQTPSGQSADASRLRPWLASALQVGPRPFSSAQEAHYAFAELPESVEPQPVVPEKTARAAVAAPVAPTPIERHADVQARPADKSADKTADKTIDKAPEKAPEKASDQPAVYQPAVYQPPVYQPAKPVATLAPAAEPARSPHHGVLGQMAPVLIGAPAVKQAPQAAAPRSSRVNRFLIPALGVLVVAQAVVIGGLLSLRPQTIAVELVAPAVLPAPADVVAVRGLGGDPAGSLAQKPVPTAADIALAGTQAASEPAPVERATPAGERFGGIRVSSAIELQVYEGGKLVGSTAGPIAVPDGSHSLELVNEALGFRSRETVIVKAGQMAAITIALPNGRISINAMPWADVSIDGKPVGQTPLANLAVAIGTHEIVFRHPQLGEQRQTAVVKAEGLTRVSAALQK